MNNPLQVKLTNIFLCRKDQKMDWISVTKLSQIVEHLSQKHSSLLNVHKEVIIRSNYNFFATIRRELENKGPIGIPGNVYVYFKKTL